MLWKKMIKALVLLVCALHSTFHIKAIFRLWERLRFFNNWLKLNSLTVQNTVLAVIDDACSKYRASRQSWTENSVHLPDAREHLFVKPIWKVYARTENTVQITFIYADINKNSKLSIFKKKNKCSNLMMNYTLWTLWPTLCKIPSKLWIRVFSVWK